jgi:hypothetical protein
VPEFGRIPASLVIARNGAATPAPAPWEVAGVTAQMVTFEVDVEAVLDLLPDLLSRPAPPYARILVHDYPDSPIGPYREALLLISSRFAMLPRHFVAASVVNAAAAKEANLANWHYVSDLGEVELAREGDSFRSRIRLPSGLEVRVDSPHAQETGPAVIRYDPLTVVYADEEGRPALFTISAEPAKVSQAWLATGSTVTYAGGDPASPWLRLRSRNPITGTIAVQDVVLPEPRPVRAGMGVGGGLP